MTTTEDQSTTPTTEDVAARLNADRKARQLTWPKYAALLGMPQTTIYKICMGTTTRCHVATLKEIEAALAKAAEKDAEGEQPNTEVRS